jgi:hypothetical protein
VPGPGGNDTVPEAVYLRSREVRRLLSAAALVAAFFLVHVESSGGSGIYPRALTWYDSSVCWDARCTTASGWSAWSIEGAAACGAAFPLWTRLRFEGTDFVATCIDRGAAWHFYSTEVDLFVRSHAEGRWLVDWLDGRMVEVLE